jgi:hypothetical protein
VAFLVLAAAAYAGAAWSERHQDHSYLWTVDGSRFRVTAFRAPFHSHSRVFPWAGIQEITSTADPDRPGTEMLVLVYGPLEYRIPTHSAESIRHFDRYVERLQDLLRAVKAGRTDGYVLQLDPFFVATAGSAVGSGVFWLAFFVTVLRFRTAGPGRRDPAA